MELTIRQPKEIVKDGQLALQELKRLVTSRPDKLVINNRQYLYFSDWQTLGAFCNITAKVVETQEINHDRPSETGTMVFTEPVGFWARAVAVNNEGREVSAAEAECMFDEPNWKNKPRFQVRSMAQTRACAKALRNCLSWIVRLPTSQFSDEVAEEQQEQRSSKQTKF